MGDVIQTTGPARGENSPIWQLLKHAFPAVPIGDETTPPNLFAPLRTDEVLYSLLLPDGLNSRFVVPRQGWDEGSPWYAFTTPQTLDVLAAAAVEFWRLIVMVDQYQFWGISLNNIILPQMLLPVIEGIRYAFCTNAPVPLFASPVLAPHRYNDMLIHYMRCKFAFQVAQKKLGISDAQRLSDFMWEHDHTSTSNNVVNDMDILALAIELGLQTRHIPCFFYVLKFEKPHPFVSFDNNVTLLTYHMEEKLMEERPLETLPLLQREQIQLIDQNLTTASPNTIIQNIPSLARQLELPKQIVLLVANALQTGTRPPGLVPSQFAFIMSYMAQRDRSTTTTTPTKRTTGAAEQPAPVAKESSSASEKTVVHVTTEEKRSPASKKKQRVKASPTITTNDTMVEAPKNQPRKRAHEDRHDEAEQMRDTKQPKLEQSNAPQTKAQLDAQKIASELKCKDPIVEAPKQIIANKTDISLVGGSKNDHASSRANPSSDVTTPGQNIMPMPVVAQIGLRRSKKVKSQAFNKEHPPTSWIIDPSSSSQRDQQKTEGEIEANMRQTDFAERTDHHAILLSETKKDDDTVSEAKDPTLENTRDNGDKQFVEPEGGDFGAHLLEDESNNMTRSGSKIMHNTIHILVDVSALVLIFACYYALRISTSRI